MDDYLGCDMLVKERDLQLQAIGDVSIVSRIKCLQQDLLNALTTPKGSLFWHPNYGVDIFKYIKMTNTATNRLQLILDIKRTINADPRVQIGKTIVTVTSWDLQKIKIKIQVLPIKTAHPLNFVLGYGVYGADGEVVG